jgi:hypothetical protein
VAAARLARKLLATVPLSSIVQAELGPGAAGLVDANEDNWIDWMRDNCKMAS